MYKRQAEEAATRQHTPKIAFVSPPKDYRTSSGKAVKAGEVDLLVRALSMGKLHHATVSYTHLDVYKRQGPDA